MMEFKIGDKAIFRTDSEGLSKFNGNIVTVCEIRRVYVHYPYRVYMTKSVLGWVAEKELFPLGTEVL